MTNKLIMPIARSDHALMSDISKATSKEPVMSLSSCPAFPW